MQIIPAINCPDAACVKQRFSQIANIFSGSSDEQWVHIDIADGSFTSGHATWRTASELAILVGEARPKIEAHLMLANSTSAIVDWLNVGVNRIIVHANSVFDLSDTIARCASRQVEFTLALSPDVNITQASAMLDQVRSCLLLAVQPGLSGQRFDPATITKIRQVRADFPNLMIEVDGGINLETARACAGSGAHRLAAASYIFEAPDPKTAYESLRVI